MKVEKLTVCWELQFYNKVDVNIKKKCVKEYEIEIQFHSQVFQEAKLVWYAKCNKPLWNKLFQNKSVKEEESKTLLRLLHSRAKKRFSEMVSPHHVMERADSVELKRLLCQKEILM